MLGLVDWQKSALVTLLSIRNLGCGISIHHYRVMLEKFQGKTEYLYNILGFA
jgi:hypothetical protein